MQVYVLVSVCRERKMPGDLMYHTLSCSLLEPRAKLASSKPRSSPLSVPAHRPGVAGTWFVFVSKWVLRSELMSSCLRSNSLLSLQPWLPWFYTETLTAAFHEICLTPRCQDWMNNATSSTEHYLGLKLFCFLFSTCLPYIPNTKIHFHQFWWNLEIRFSTQTRSSVSHCPCYDTGTQRSEFPSIALAWRSVASACAPQIIFLPVVFLGKLLALHCFPPLFWLAFLSYWWMPLGQFMWCSGIVRDALL